MDNPISRSPENFRFPTDLPGLRRIPKQRGPAEAVGDDVRLEGVVEEDGGAVEEAEALLLKG